MTIDFSSLPPEHTCKDARSLSQIYADNRKHAAEVLSRNVDGVLDYYQNQYCTRTWGGYFVDALIEDPDITIREFFENGVCVESFEDFDPDIDYGECREVGDV